MDVQMSLHRDHCWRRCGAPGRLGGRYVCGPMEPIVSRCHLTRRAGEERRLTASELTTIFWAVEATAMSLMKAKSLSC